MKDTVVIRYYRKKAGDYVWLEFDTTSKLFETGLSSMQLPSNQYEVITNVKTRKELKNTIELLKNKGYERESLVGVFEEVNENEN